MADFVGALDWDGAKALTLALSLGARGIRLVVDEAWGFERWEVVVDGAL